MTQRASFSDEAVFPSYDNVLMRTGRSVLDFGDRGGQHGHLVQGV